MEPPRDVERRQAVLQRAGFVLASELSLPALLQKIVELACEVAEARYGALGVLGPTGRISEFVTHGVSDDQRAAIGRLPSGHGILGVLIAEAHPLRLDDISADPRSYGFPPNHPAMKTFLGVPVAVRGKVFGNLYLTEKAGGISFTQDDENSVIALASYAAVAVENARLYHDAQVGRARLEALSEVTHAILRGDDVDDVLVLIARRARELIEADLATIAVPAGDDDTLVLRVAHGAHADAFRGAQFPREGSIAGDVMRSLDPIVVDDASADSRVMQPLVKIGGVGSAAFVPLAVRDRVFGALALANVAGRPHFGSEEIAVVQTFAAQAAVALEYARVQEELQRLLVAEERERIAKELHDDVIQSLFAEGMALQAAEAHVHQPEVMRARLSAAVDNIDRVIRDLRNYIFGLSPGAAADRQLEQSLVDIAERYTSGAGITVDVQADPDAVSRLATRAGDVVQVAREAISNAARHSGTNTIMVRLTRRDGDGVLEIVDEGTGFDVAAATGAGHGLTNLRARAQALSARLDIDSAPGKGTTVRVSIPLEER